MQLVPTMVDNSGIPLPANDFNPIPLEEENAIRDTNQTLSAGDLYQLSKAMAVYSAIGNYCNDSGTANNYVLSRTTFSPPFQIRPLPEILNGTRVRFFPGASNTGACNVNIDGLTSYPIKLSNGNDPLPGDISSIVECFLTIDNFTAYLSNPQNPAELAWPPMTIRGLEISPGSVPTDQYNISSGNARNLSNAINITSDSSILNKSVSSTWAEGNGVGSVPSNILSTWLAGVPADETVHVFIICKSDGITCDSAIDTSITGSNILLDTVINAAGYIYVRRVASLFVSAIATVRPVEFRNDTFHFLDDIKSFSLQLDASTVASTYNLNTPQIQCEISITLSCRNISNEGMWDFAIYPTNASEPSFPSTNSNAGLYCFQNVDVGIALWMYPQQATILTDSSGFISLISDRNSSGVLYTACFNYRDNRSTF